MLEAIQRESNKERKLDLFFCQELKDRLKGQSVFPLLRLLLPKSDTKRARFGIKHAKLASLYIKVLNLENTEDGEAIIMWCHNKVDPSNPEDLPDAIFKAATARINTNKVHTVGQVNEVLDKLAHTFASSSNRFAQPAAGTAAAAAVAAQKASGKLDQKGQLIKRIATEFPPLEQKWIMRIILGSTEGLKVGLNDEPVLRKISPGALQKYNECSDMQKACEDTNAAALEVGQACAPMLAKYFSGSNAKLEQLGNLGVVENAMRSRGSQGAQSVAQPFTMDKKIDGERLLFHCEGRGNYAKLKSFSRNGKESSQLYLSSMILAESCLAPEVNKVILDGEIIIWDREACCYIPFGTNYAVASIESNLARSKLPTSGFGDSAGVEERLNVSKEAAEYSMVRGMVQGKNGNPRGVLKTGEEVDLNKHGIKFIIFDILYVEGENIEAMFCESRQAVERDLGIEMPPAHSLIQGQITHFPLALRREVLRRIIAPIEHRVELIEHQVVSVVDKNLRINLLGSFFETAVRNNEEGLVIKNLTAPYVFGEESRQKNASWVKLKPDYGDEIKGLDVIIVGAKLGEGKGFRGAGIAAFLVAVKADLRAGETEAEFSATPRFAPVGWVGSGFNYDKLTLIRAALDPIKISFKTAQKAARTLVFPDWFAGSPQSKPYMTKSDDVPDFLIPWQQSIVLTVKCFQIYQTETFPSGLSMRFPRLCEDGIRKDKNPLDILTMANIVELFRKGNADFISARDASKKRGGAGGGGGAKKKQATEKVDSIHKSVHLGDKVKRESDIFNGIKFNVQGGSFFEGSRVQKHDATNITLSKAAIETSVQMHGATVCASAESDCIVLVGPKESQSVSNLIAHGRLDVMKVEWALDCILHRRLVPKKPAHFKSQTEETREYLTTGQDMDLLGDSYTQEVTEEELRELLESMDVRKIEGKIGKIEIEEVVKVGSKRGSAAATIPSLEERDLLEAKNEAKKARNQERRNIVNKDLSKMSKLSNWRDIAASCMTNEERGIIQGNANLFWKPGTVFYLDLYADMGGTTVDSGKMPRRSDGADLLPIPLPALLSLRSILPLHGAIVSTTLHVGVTHVITDPVDILARIPILRERREELRRLPGSLFEKRLVFPSWVYEILSAEDPYQAFVKPISSRHLVPEDTSFPADDDDEDYD
jgi:ATP-dependent DNA ligase